MLNECSVWAQIPVNDVQRAQRFYTDTLGLKPGPQMPYGGATFESADGTGLALYETPSAGKAAHTLASWKVSNLDAEMADLRDRGVTFEEYDMPEIGIKTMNGVATMGDFRAAWFKDIDGNILCVAQM